MVLRSMCYKAVLRTAEKAMRSACINACGHAVPRFGNILAGFDSVKGNRYSRVFYSPRLCAIGVGFCTVRVLSLIGSKAAVQSRANMPYYKRPSQRNQISVALASAKKFRKYRSPSGPSSRHSMPAASAVARCACAMASGTCSAAAALWALSGSPSPSPCTSFTTRPHTCRVWQMSAFHLHRVIIC